MSRPELAALRLGDSPSSWEALGFTILDGGAWLGGVSIELGATGPGIVGWRLRGGDLPASIDGLETSVDPSPPAAGRANVDHPNGATGLDHVVVLTPDFDRSASVLARFGMPLRRVRQASPTVRQGFRRLGPTILELVEASELGPGPARFWGLVVTVTELDALAERLGDRLGAVKPAVQPGRRIATLRASAGLGQAVAFISPERDRKGVI